jgi:heme/copper-type cytochrome/quinol oxidase subunit 4
MNFHMHKLSTSIVAFLFNFFEKILVAIIIVTYIWRMNGHIRSEERRIGKQCRL